MSNTKKIGVLIRKWECNLFFDLYIKNKVKFVLV